MSNGMHAALLILGLSALACKEPEIVLELEIAYPMIGRQQSVYAAQRINVGDNSLQAGQTIEMSLDCVSNKLCSLLWPSRPEEVRKIEGRVLMINDGEIVVSPAPFPVPQPGESEALALRFDGSLTKIVEARYRIPKAGVPRLISWRYLRTEDRPPIKWK